MNRRALAKAMAAVAAVCMTSLLYAAEVPRASSAAAKTAPVKANTAVIMKVVRLQGTVSWPSGPGNPTAADATTACGQVKVAASKETPSGGMMPKVETLGEANATAVDAKDRSKGCSYAIMGGLPSGEALKVSARFTGPWSSALGGGYVGSEAATVTLKTGTNTQNLSLKVNAIK